MVNLNGSNNVHEEGSQTIKSSELPDDCDNLIWTTKARNYMNEENEENLSRVHVLCCHECDFLTISLKVLQQHMLVLHSKTNQDFDDLVIYSCRQCNCVSTELKLIQEHIKIFHNVSTENSSNSSKSEKFLNENKILTQSMGKNIRKPNHIKLVKTQLKMRKKILKRKSMKIKQNNFLTSDIDIEEDDNNNNNVLVIGREVKKENMQHNERVEVGQNIDENDPLDMSMKSTTCPFKSVKFEPIDNSNFDYPMKQEPGRTENYDTLNNNSINNNHLLSNPQTCIELIKLTLSQMLNKTTEQNRLSHIGFNPTFLQPQFQLPSNIIPLLFPTSSQSQNTSQTTSQNEISFPSKIQDIESILANIQQQNLLNSVSPKSFDQNTQMMGFQQPPLYLNHKMTGSVPINNKGFFVENTQKNGNLTISPISVYNSKKSNEYQCKTPNKRSLKKQPLPTKVRNGLNEELNYIQSSKFESPKGDSENLFNRSFLDTTELDISSDQLDLSKVLDGQETLDAHINLSNKSSPNTSDKPHRQNFTSQQNRILSDWFFTHCDKPYPSTEDTKELSQLSGLTYSQVKKWFANKRARSSLNKKNHKNYCLLNATESTMDEMANNDMCSISPSSESQKSYINPAEVPREIDFTTFTQEELQPQNE